MAFRVQGEVLFNSGQAELTAEGKKALSSLVPILRERQKDIRIDGHTDTDPIRHSKWKTNLRLSAERAMAVQDFLAENQFDPAHMSISAYGPYKPAVAGDTTEAKRSNRRVEILMLEQ